MKKAGIGVQGESSKQGNNQVKGGKMNSSGTSQPASKNCRRKGKVRVEKSGKRNLDLTDQQKKYS